MHSKRYTILWLLLFAPISLFAQDRSIFTKLGDDFSETITLGGRYFNFPSRFDKEDWRNFGSTIALTASLMAFDQPAKDGMQSLAAKGNLDPLMSFFRGCGEIKYVAPASGIVYLGGLVTGSETAHRISKEVLQSLLYSGIVTTTVKFTLGRSRPYNEDGPFFFDPFEFEDSHLSMPSGHTTIAFAVSSVLAAEIDNTYASIGLHTAAAMVGISRMYHNAHWLSDVFLGAAIGASTGYFVVHENKKDKDTAEALMIRPTLTGLSLTYKF